MAKEHKIQVLGSGCSGCKKLHVLAQEAVKQLGLELEVEYVNDVTKIIELGIMQSPAMTVDDKVVLAGYIPDAEQVREAILHALEVSGDVKAEDVSEPEAKASGCDCAGSGCC